MTDPERSTASASTDAGRGPLSGASRASGDGPVRLAEDGPRPELSVVIPLYNEVETVPRLATELTAALDDLRRSWEVVVVDDGSTDGSFDALEAVSESDPRFTVIRFRRNFGQTPAFAAGFDAARGEIVVTMDADLQNDPADIAKVLAEMDAGDYDIVSGWRQDRKEPLLLRRVPSMFGNRVMN
ncbi:MAG: glycosyltransferase family 2 protein, partial [Anaerolineae bacterium]